MWWSRLTGRPRLGPVAAIAWQRMEVERFLRLMAGEATEELN